MDNLKSHALANLLPDMSENEMNDLVSDMSENGYRAENPIYLFEGKILDGRNRYAASKIAGVNPTFTEYKGADAWKFVVSQNLHRRHLDETQRAGVASRRANMTEGGDHSANLQSGKVSVAEAAKEMNVSPRTVATYRAVAAAMPELIEKMDSGEMTAHEAHKRMKIEANKNKRAAPMPDGKYRIIYADCPWKYTSGEQHSNEEQQTVLGTHYPSMSIRELCDLPIKNMAQDNSVLFMWVTSPLLEECFDVINAWGFKYKASIIWDKMAHNVGHYVSVRHELLLICTRGSCTPDSDKLLPSVVSEKRTEHSVKPETFRQMIDAMYPTGKRIELFARRDVDGWDKWGNE